MPQLAAQEQSLYTNFNSNVSIKGRLYGHYKKRKMPGNSRGKHGYR